MQTIQAVIMGAAQGISEFLPISSSAHIVFSSMLYKIFAGTGFQNVGSEEIFFDILIHLASLFAVIIFFFKDLKEIVTGFFRGLINKDYESPEFKTGVYVLFATLVTCIMAFFIKDMAHRLVENPAIVAGLILITGFVLFFSEKLKRPEKKMDFKTVLFIGIAQGFAIFPGLSRSGLTIATGIFNGVERTKAARFSFILSIPIIIIASLIYPLLEINPAEIQNFNLKAMALGCLVSFVTGFLCIKYFMKFLEKFNLKCFAYYCWAAGILMIFVSLKFN